MGYPSWGTPDQEYAARHPQRWPTEVFPSLDKLAEVPEVVPAPVKLGKVRVSVGDVEIEMDHGDVEAVSVQVLILWEKTRRSTPHGSIGFSAALERSDE